MKVDEDEAEEIPQESAQVQSVDLSFMYLELDDIPSTSGAGSLVDDDVKLHDM